MDERKKKTVSWSRVFMAGLVAMLVVIGTPTYDDRHPYEETPEEYFRRLEAKYCLYMWTTGTAGGAEALEDFQP